MLNYFFFSRSLSPRILFLCLCAHCALQLHFNVLSTLDKCVLRAIEVANSFEFFTSVSENEKKNVPDFICYIRKSKQIHRKTPKTFLLFESYIRMPNKIQVFSLSKFHSSRAQQICIVHKYCNNRRELAILGQKWTKKSVWQNTNEKRQRTLEMD